MTRLRSGGRLGVIAVVAAVVVAPSLASADGVTSRLAGWGLLPGGTSFSELSLLQNEDLFETVSLSGHVRFAVAATNVSPESRRYAWSATVGPAGAPERVDGGSFTLAGGATKTVPVTFDIPDCEVRNRISVRLTTEGQRSPEVHYWVLPRNSAAWKVSGGPSCAA